MAWHRLQSDGNRWASVYTWSQLPHCEKTICSHASQRCDSRSQTYYKTFVKWESIQETNSPSIKISPRDTTAPTGTGAQACQAYPKVLEEPKMPKQFALQARDYMAINLYTSHQGTLRNCSIQSNQEWVYSKLLARNYRSKKKNPLTGVDQKICKTTTSGSSL